MTNQHPQPEWGSVFVKQVASTARREQARRPPPPFTTSTLQQEASAKLGLSPSRTMATAQQLYEGPEEAGGALPLTPDASNPLPSFWSLYCFWHCGLPSRPCAMVYLVSACPEHHSVSAVLGHGYVADLTKRCMSGHLAQRTVAKGHELSDR